MKKKQHTTFWVIIMVLSIPTICCAQNETYAEKHYVTQEGAGSRNGTKGNEWGIADFHKTDNWSRNKSADGKIGPGDVVYFSGDFTMRVVVTNGGSAEGPVTLDGYEAGDCDPINEECTMSADLKKGMEIGNGTSGPDYLTIQDFRMTRDDGKNPTFKIYTNQSGNDDSKHADNLNIRRNLVYLSDGTMFYYYQGRNSIVENNRFVHFGQHGTDATQGFNLIEVDDFILRGNEIGHNEKAYPSGCKSAEMIELHGCKRVLIEGNDIYGAPNQAGIRPKEHTPTNMEDLIIRYNKVHSNNHPLSGKGIYLRTRATGVDFISNVYIYGNFVYSNGIAGLMFGQGVSNIHAWSNIITDNGRFGIDIWQGPADGMYFYNNTIARNGTKGETENDRGGFVFAAGTNIHIKNNILWNNRPGGEGKKYNQLWSMVTLSSLEHNSYFHSLSEPDFYYNNSFHSLLVMQESYNYEKDAPAGEITDYGFLNPAGLDNMFGTQDDNYHLNGNHSNDGVSLSKCFEITIQDSIYTICYDDGLDPSLTDWTINASQLQSHVNTLKRDTYGWSRGAYVYNDPYVEAHYVTQAGAGDHSGASLENAYSIADFNALTGDHSGSIYYFSGTFTSQVTPNIHGTASNHVTLDGYEAGNGSNGAVIFRNQAVNIRGMWIQNQSYMTIQDFEIKECGVGLWMGDGTHHINIYRNKIHDMLDRGINGAWNATQTGVTHIVIGGSLANGNELYNIGCGTSAGDIIFTRSSDIVISYNKLYATKDQLIGAPTDRGIDGIVLVTSVKRVLIEYNEIYNHWDDYGPDPTGSGSAPLVGKGEDAIDIKNDLKTESGRCHDIIIRFNKMWNNRQSNITLQTGTHNVAIYGNRIGSSTWGGLYLNEGAGGCAIEVHHIYAWGNIIENEPHGGIVQHYPSSWRLSTMHDFYFWNNDLMANATAPATLNHTNFYMNDVTGTNLFKNNILYKGRPNEGDYLQYYSEDNEFETDYNLYQWPGQISQSHVAGVTSGSDSFETHAVMADDTQVTANTAGGDYTLSEGSLAINSGVSIMLNIPSITVRGIVYPFDPAEALLPETNWDHFPSPQTIRVASQNDHGSGWERGAYVYPQKNSVSTPSLLSGTVQSNCQINLSWTDNSNNETGFVIQRSVDGVNFNNIDSVTANETTYRDTILQAATEYYYRVYAWNAEGVSGFSNKFSATTLVTTSPTMGMPQGYYLEIYPNPFGDSATIRYSMHEKGHVRVDVYDFSGRSVKVLVDAVKSSGEHQVSWVRDNLAKGIYICMMMVRNTMTVKKIILK